MQGSSRECVLQPNLAPGRYRAVYVKGFLLPITSDLVAELLTVVFSFLVISQNIRRVKPMQARDQKLAGIQASSGAHVGA